MPSSISKSRLRKAFDEGRRSAASDAAQNPYDNPKLRKLWDDGRARQRAGELTTPVPPLEHGETRAQRAQQNPPGSKRTNQPPPRPRGGPRPGFGGPRPGFGGPRPGGGGGGGGGFGGGRPRPRGR